MASATARVTRACERNSALFAQVLANETFQQTLLDELDVDSLAHTAAACVAGRAAVEALGDEPWLEAIKAIERDLTHGELPPAEKGVYSTKAARAAGEAAHAQETAAFKSRYPASEDIWLENSCRQAYENAHRVAMNRAAKVCCELRGQLRRCARISLEGNLFGAALTPLAPASARSTSFLRKSNSGAALSLCLSCKKPLASDSDRRRESDCLTRPARRKLLTWAQECVARSRVFHNEAANSWDFGTLEDFDRFAEFMVRHSQRVVRVRGLRASVWCDERAAF